MFVGVSSLEVKDNCLATGYLYTLNIVIHTILYQSINSIYSVIKLNIIVLFSVCRLTRNANIICFTIRRYSCIGR